jgi:hypothetical protein
MKNEDIIKQIARWQVSDYVHGLTCGSDTCNHVLLEPIEKNGKVILVCPTEGCDYEQEYLPKCVLDADIEKMEQSIMEIFNKMKGID